jgi:hypothetical protein
MREDGSRIDHRVVNRAKFLTPPGFTWQSTLWMITVSWHADRGVLNSMEAP